MLHKTLYLTITAFILSATLVIANDKPSLDIGTTVFLSMTGDLAQKYSQQKLQIPKDQKSPRGLMIATSARIVQKLKDGRFRIESVSRPDERSKQPLLITLTATVKRDAIKESQTPAGTLVYSSPLDKNPVATTKPTTSYRIQLNNLKGVKLQTWKLQSEIGD